MALTMRESTFRPRLLAAVSAALPQGGRVLDVGCGTGTFAIALAAARPGRAGRRASTATPRRWRSPAPSRDRPPSPGHEGLATALPRADASADAVVMSLLLHHLSPAAKRAALAEAARVLKPGGSLHVADWGRPHDPLMRAAFFGLQLVDGFADDPRPRRRRTAVLHRRRRLRRRTAARAPAHRLGQPRAVERDARTNRHRDRRHAHR